MTLVEYMKSVIRLRSRFILFAITGASFIFSATSSAADLNNLIGVADKKLKVAQASQSKVDKLSEERRSLYNDYKAVNKEIEGLRIYNKQLNKQILEQRKEMERIRNTIEGVTVTQRQITPLMLRMIEGLKQFVALDMPFLKEERANRVARLEELIDQTNITVAEKFRSVIQAYQIENEYGRTIESYTATQNIDGVDREVSVLRVGRIAMVYQTPDGKYSGFWSQETGDWEITGSGADRSSFAEGLKIANKQSAPDLITLPVEAPETAQ